MITVTIGMSGEGLAEPWRDLVSRSSSNVFMDPAALNAVTEMHFADVRMLLAWEQGAEPPRLVGLWALRLQSVGWLWPSLLEALPHNYAVLSNPVIDPHYVSDVIPAFFAAIAGSALPHVISLRSFDTEQPSYAAIVAAMAEQGGAPLKLRESLRPVVTRSFGIKKSGATRKKLRQDANRLAALGVIDVVNARAPQDVRAAFEIFLAMEAASWKGKRGTALLSSDTDAAFVRHLIAGLADEGNASVALLRIDGRAIAAQVLMYCGATAYTWKIAYVREYARYSPGTLLVDKVAEQLFATPGIETVDSCSVADGFMGRLWAGRYNMVDMLVDVGPGRSLSFTFEAGRQRAYHWLRALRNRARSGRVASLRTNSVAAEPVGDTANNTRV